MPSTLEWIAVLLGIANILLLVRRSIWNYPVGILMVALYFEVFREARLYSDMGLQLFFAAVQAYGWYAWSRAGGMDGPIEVERLNRTAILGWLAAIAFASVAWGQFMDLYTNAASPFWDAGIAMGSVAAQILLTRRKIENWAVWIGVDAVAIGVYWSRGLMLTSGLYCLFLILCIVGLIEWRRVEARQRADNVRGTFA